MIRNRILFWGTVAALVLLASFLIYRYWFPDNLNVTPDARRAIEKAKRR